MKNQTSKQGSEKKSTKIKRRQFFTIIGNSAIGMVTIGSCGVIYDFLSPRVLLEVPSRFKVGTPETMQPNSVIFDAEHRLFVFRDVRGFFYAVSAICTHLGCTAQWKPDGIPGYKEGVIACPCHGSVFSKTGNVLRGPAPRALDRFRMSLEDGKLVIDTAEKVDENEMILKV